MFSFKEAALFVVKTTDMAASFFCEGDSCHLKEMTVHTNVRSPFSIMIETDHKHSESEGLRNGQRYRDEWSQQII